MAALTPPISHDFSSLEKLCFEVFFKKVVCKTTTPATVEFLRDHMDLQFQGTVKKKIREQCISKFNESAESRQGLIPNVFVLLDCILDSNFVKLEICVPESAFPSFPKLMANIAHRAPKLKELNIHFILNSCKNLPNLLMQPTQSHFLLSCLEKLSLTLHGKPAGQPGVWKGHCFPGSKVMIRPIARLIGKHCPVLSSLKVKGFCGLKEGILGLVFGELVSSLFPDGPNNWNWMLQNLLAPYQFLSLLCFSIEELDWDVSMCHLCSSNDPKHSLHHSMLTFTLRHLTKLQKLETRSSPEDFIEAIRNLAGMEMQLPEFDQACEAAAVRIGQERNSISPNDDGIFSGSLSLSKFCVPIESSGASTIFLVGKKCPNLNSVRFTNGSRPRPSRDSRSKRGEPESPKELEVSLPGLEIVLNQWPKLETIETLFLSLKYTRPILQVFGPTLRILTLRLMEDPGISDQLDMALLGPLTQLKQLTLHALPRSTVFIKANNPGNWTEKTFLPMLSKFEANFCLGKWAPLFERKSLIDLKLMCCHIGIKAPNLHLEWDANLPLLWPQLEFLHVEKCSGRLTIAKIAQLLPHMPNLKKLRLPQWILDEEPELSRQTIKRFEGIDIGSFFDPSLTNDFPCLFQAT